MASHNPPDAAPTHEPEMDDVNRYLWGVYQRAAVKRDGSGDFTWKDVASAARVGMSLGDYVVRGMDRDFREVLYRAGLAIDAAGFRWTITSAFRDDYRQFLAAGYKARIGDSLHGGSATTGGYGHGCAVDIKDADGGGNSSALWAWVDAHSMELGLQRPLPGIDPSHLQPRGPWHEVAVALRNQRLGNATPPSAAAPDDGSAPSDPTTEASNLAPSEEDMLCIGLHHHRNDPISSVMPAPVGPQGAELASTSSKPVTIDKPPAKPHTRAAALPLGSGKESSKDAKDSKNNKTKSGTQPAARHALHASGHPSGAI